MLKNPQTEEQMIAEGADFRIGKMYYKYIKGKLYWAKADSEEWQTAYIQESTWDGTSKYVNLRKEENKMTNNVQNELYASLELQITMAQDYSEWLKQETKRNNELLESHSSALSRLNELMVQSPSENEKVDSGTAQELPDGLKWEDAPRWATFLAKPIDDGGKGLFWCNSTDYVYSDYNGINFPFCVNSRFENLSDLEIIATRPEGV